MSVLTTINHISRKTICPFPQSFNDLLDPAYNGLLVVENPATSSPGLAFLMATIAEFSTDGYLDFWQGLKENGRGRR